MTTFQEMMAKLKQDAINHTLDVFRDGLPPAGAVTPAPLPEGASDLVLRTPAPPDDPEEITLPHNHTPTSQASAEASRPSASRQRGLVYRTLETVGTATREELQGHTGLAMQSLSPRVWELLGKSRDPVAGRVALALEASGLSQSALAEALGTAQSTVQNWVAQGKPPGAAHLAKIPGILKVNGHWLLTGQGPTEPPGETPQLYQCRCGGPLFGLDLGKYGCPNCNGAQGAASLTTGKEPTWSTPIAWRGGWWSSQLVGHGSNRVRCKLAVSQKGEIQVLAGAPDYPGAVAAALACYAAAQPKR